MIALGFCSDAGIVTVDLSIVLLAGLDVENWRIALRVPLDLATARKLDCIIVDVVVVYICSEMCREFKAFPLNCRDFKGVFSFSPIPQ